MFPEFAPFSTIFIILFVCFFFVFLPQIDRLKKQNFDIRAELAEKLCVLDDTETKLKEKTLECTKTCKMVEKLIKTITEQDKELEKLKRNSVRHMRVTACYVNPFIYSVMFYLC